jgi:chromosome segregation ATPase
VIQCRAPEMSDQIETIPLDELQSLSVLQEAKKRKQVEDDSLRLRNRLLQLERQAHKAEKRIVQTKQRAKDILDQRQRNERRECEKRKFIEELEHEILQHREDIAKCVASSCMLASPATTCSNPSAAQPNPPQLLEVN